MDDDIERILREVEALEGGRPAGRPKPEPTAAPEQGRGGGVRAAWLPVAAAGGGAAGFLVGLLLGFLPWISPISTGLGAALGAALIALVSGPPRWFGR